jgi:pimeloyl-ACP methyl ester carboxylesterase
MHLPLLDSPVRYRLRSVLPLAGPDPGSPNLEAHLPEVPAVRVIASLLVLTAATVFAPTALAQSSPQLSKPGKLPNSPRERIDKIDNAERLKRIAITGDLGFPMLPPVFWDSPQDDLQYVDRFPFNEPPPGSIGDSSTPPALDGVIPSGPSGTGTSVQEVFKYLLPAGYETFQEGLPPIPLVMAYHGYGSSANSVALLSDIDDECYERGWAYFAPTGMDDQLFGSPLCLQNVEAALNWMLTHFNIDRDRIYLVGFSMGGGIAANFAARHRDPDGTMIAALGIVSGTFDWTMTWKLGNSTLKTLMESPFNFSGPASSSTYKYNYQKASGLFYTYASYPPLVPSLAPNEIQSLSTNLGSVPTYIVWDTGDTLAEVVLQEAAFYNLVQSMGGIVNYHTVTGTLHPINGTPAPHSWAVLDENALFDFFADKVVDRTPDSFHALIAESGNVSWVSVQQNFTNTFSLVDADMDPEIPYVQLSNVLNAKSVAVDVSTLGLSAGDPMRVNAGGTTGNFELTLGGFAEPPAYLVDAATGDLITGTESNPLADALSQNVIAPGGIDAIVVTDPSWDTDLTTGPNPVVLGGALDVDIDAPATGSLALLFIGFQESLGTIAGGYHITLQLGPPTIFLELPLDANGDYSLAGTMPNDPALTGLTFLMQAVAVGGGTGVQSISNLWSLHVQ